MSLAQQFRVAAIVPCYNEEVTVATVVRDLYRHVPGVTVFVYDNASSDRTVELARQAGAIVRTEPMKGKGNAVRRAFADIDADIYLLIDGDDTYDAAAAPAMIETLVRDNLDHVLGVRREVEVEDGSSAYRPNHEFGNRMLNNVVTRIFGDSQGDMLSGYRVFSRRFVKSFPAMSRGFEIETELTVHSLTVRVPSGAVEVGFKDRPAGSESKLSTYRDGFRILNLIGRLTRHERPMLFFGGLAVVTFVAALFAATMPTVAFLQTGTLPRAAAVMPAVILTLATILALVAGAVLDGLRKTRHELSRLTYLRLPAVRVTEPAPVADRLHVPAMRRAESPTGPVSVARKALAEDSKDDAVA